LFKNYCKNRNTHSCIAVGAGMIYSIQLHWLQSTVGD